MTPDEWAVVKEIAAAALEHPAAERHAFVTGRCGADHARLREVESLLDSVTHATNLYEHPRFSATHLLTSLADGDAGASPIGRRVGAYRILAEIGRGGMGAAYLAERDDRAYQKRVAIKLIKRGMDSDAILRRFRQERQILADLEHPNIVRLLDGGTTDDGLPYFVMEYVDGVPIDAYCDKEALSLPARLALFRTVCDAVQHAHEHRVVHRDLKPSNILVTKSGTPKLLDFGIARLLNPDADDQTGDPTMLAGVMTPQYASPEQVRGGTPTEASDVYSLGVLLYLLLTGRPPYRLEGSRRDAERIICEQMPPKPSAVVERPRRAALRGDLDTIALTALQKEPERRYRTAGALSHDVQSHLDRLPIVATRPPRLRSRVRTALAVAAVLFLVIALGLLDRRGGSSSAAAEARSIAVLPLATGGDDPEVDYLADGITEDVINRLSRLPQLRVIARDSAYRYKGKAIDPQQVGRELGIEAVLSGRVVQRGTTLSIATELVDTRDGRQLWGERYERPVDDVQAVQRELAERIAASLRLQFTSDQRALLARAHTPDDAAYQLYLKGRYFWNKRTPDGLTTSVAYLRQAVERDPSFALAHAGLADAYGLLTEYHTLPATETYAPAKRAAMTALDLDPNLAEAHASLAYVRQFYEWDWRGAEAEYQRALALNANYATAHQWYAEYLSAAGRHDEALAAIRTAISLDPVSLIVNSVEANLLYMAGRYDEAIARVQQVLALDPNFPEAYEYLKRAYDRKGLYRDAIEARQARRRILGRDVTETPALAAAAVATSARAYWRHRLTQEIAESRDEGLLPFEFAEILAQAGDIPRALDWLERACREHDFMMSYVRVAPNLQPLRAEPRYADIVRRGCSV